MAELREYLLQAGPEAESMKSKKPMAKEKFTKKFSTVGREFKQRQSQMLKQALIQDFQRMHLSSRQYHDNPLAGLFIGVPREYVAKFTSPPR